MRDWKGCLRRHAFNMKADCNATIGSKSKTFGWLKWWLVHQSGRGATWLIGCWLLLETRLLDAASTTTSARKPHSLRFAFFAIAISFRSLSSFHILIQLAIFRSPVCTVYQSIHQLHPLLSKCSYSNHTMDSMLNQPSPASTIGTTTKSSPARSASNTNVTKRLVSMSYLSYTV